MLSRQLLAVVSKQCRSFDGSQRRSPMTWHTRHTYTCKQFKSFAVESIDPLHKLYVLDFESNQIAFGIIGYWETRKYSVIFERRRMTTQHYSSSSNETKRTNIYEAQYHNQIEIVKHSSFDLPWKLATVRYFVYHLPFRLLGTSESPER